MPIKISKSAVLFLSVFGLSACQTQLTKEQIGTALGAAAGAVAGHEFSDGNKWAAAVAAVAVGFVGKEIGRYLDEQDQARMAQTTVRTFSTGQSQSWVNPDTQTSGQTRVVATKTKAEPVKVKVLKAKVTQVPPLDIVGETYRAKSTSNVRGGPGTDYQKVGKVASQEIVTVVGKVKEKDWFLISQDGIGSGFVYTSLLEPAPDEVIVADEATSESGEVAEYEVANTQQCRTVEQSVSLANGTTHSETIEACKGANGWEPVNA